MGAMDSACACRSRVSSTAAIAPSHPSAEMANYPSKAVPLMSGDSSRASALRSVGVVDAAAVFLEVWVRLVWVTAADLAEGLATAALAEGSCQLCAS